MKHPQNLRDTADMTECGLALYRKLLDAPPFRYALAGLEVDDFRFWKELQEDIDVLPDGKRKFLYVFNGLVLRKDCWRELGEPIDFLPFGANCVWRPYEGEAEGLRNGGAERNRKLQAMREALLDSSV